MATGRPAFGSRFHTANEESALLARGFQHGSAPGALVVGWNRHHTAVTLPDGTPVSSGEGGGVRIGGGGAYQRQFTHRMFLPMEPEAMGDQPPPDPFAPFLPEGPAPEPEPAPAQLVWAPMPAPPADEPPAEPEAAPMDFAPPPAEPEAAPMDFGPPPAEPEAAPMDFGPPPAEPAPAPMEPAPAPV